MGMGGHRVGYALRHIGRCSGMRPRVVLLVALCIAIAPVAFAQGLPVVRPGDVVLGDIADGDPVVETETLRTRYMDETVLGKAYRLEVDAAGTFTVELRSCFFDAYLVLRDEDGRVLAEDDDGLIGQQSRLVVVARPEVPMT